MTMKLRLTFPLAMSVVLLPCALSITLAEDSHFSTGVSIQETPEQRDARMSWFREARFGMFIHWGVYSVPGAECEKWTSSGNYGEWFLEHAKMPVSQYEKFAARFNPTKFNA